MTRALAVVVSGIVVIALAGCGGFPTAGPTPTGVTDSATATVTPSATPLAQPRLSDLVVTPDGFGPFHIGSPVAEQQASIAVAIWNPTECSPDAGSDGAGAWVAQYPPETWLHGPAREPFTFASAQMTSPVLLMTIWSRQLRTAAGIGVGSTLAELQAAYPSLTRVAGGTTDLYVLPGEVGQLVFDVPTDASTDVSMWTPGDLGKVAWMYLEQRGKQPFSIANSDGGVSCNP